MREPMPAPTSTCGSQHCITCGDDGDPMTVLAIDAGDGVAQCCGDDGRRMTVETALVESVAVGDRLLVHAGTALVLLPGQELRARKSRA
jgi:hydrogenase maturation factor